MKKILLALFLAAMAAFAAFVIYANVTRVDDTDKDSPYPTAFSSGRYQEILKKHLKMEVSLKDNAVWIRISNSFDAPIPSEEPHRALVCMTEIYDDKGKLIDKFNEWFKPAPYGTEFEFTQSSQILPRSTVKFAYDIAIPKGKAVVRMTYEDLSKTWSSGSTTLILDTKEVSWGGR